MAVVVEQFLKSKIGEMTKKLGLPEPQLVSPKNRLVNSFIYGIDNKQVVSPDNKLVHADLGDLDLSTNRTEEQKV